MVKQLNKHFSYDASLVDNKLYSLTYRDFLIFMKKFCGIFVFRGKKSFSIKILNYILLNLKKLKRKKNPLKLFFFLLKRVSPFLTIAQRKIGRANIAVPSLIFGNKKNILLLNWIVRTTKGKSNIFGIKKQDVLKNILDIYKFRGIAMKLKDEHNNKIKLAKINLKNEGSKKNRFSEYASEQWRKEGLLEAKYNYWWKEIDRLNEELELTPEEISEELERWKLVERKYKYTKMLKKINRRSAKKDEFIQEYKKLFVK